MCSIFLATSVFAEDAMPNTPIDFSRYAGLWYEFARTPKKHQDNTPTRRGQTFSTCTHTTARYSVRDAESLTLRNACLRRGQDGSTFEDVVEGVARVVAGSDGRRLKIAFGSTMSQFFQRIISFWGFDYWIYEVGEVSPNEPYSWAVVSGPRRDFLFLLTRDRFPSPLVTEEVVAAARSANLPVSKLVFAQE
jgi:apolipoprotein D and lipocalin family protein